jgi:flagellar motor switch protein FliN/FliY
MKNTVVSRIEMPTLSETVTARAPSLGERLDLVEHVNVKLDVVVGQVSLPIDQLFSLSAGSVLSLDTLVDTPLEVRLNGKLIARGELLAVDEHFGIQITDIVS